MRKKIVVKKLAEQDVLNASSWYESIAPTLGKDFFNEFYQTLIKLEIAPERYPFYYKNLRRVMLCRFPYKIFYRIENNNIIVFRVLHSKRDHRCFLT